MDTTSRSTVIIAGGDLGTSPTPPVDAMVIAADSGYDHARRHGLDVDVLIGDMDSISPEGLDHAMAAGIEIVRHDEDKDHTDLELAMLEAVQRRAARIDVYGAENGAIGHFLGVALGLTADTWRYVDVIWHTSSGDVRVCREGETLTIEGSPGDMLSIIPVGDASGMTVTGARWGMTRDMLPRGSSRGMSNEFQGPVVTVSIERGMAFVIWEGKRT